MTAAADLFRASAFGLDVSSEFPVSELRPMPHRGHHPVLLSLADDLELDRRWRGAGPVVLLDDRFEDGSRAIRLEADPARGHLLEAHGLGRYLIDAATERILCVPPADEPETTWQRFLLGQVLPLAAVLRGLEVLHASAVSFGGRAGAFIGPSGAGKTSLAANLSIAGAGFVCDDALAIARVGDEVLAYPGAAAMTLREREDRAIGSICERVLGPAMPEASGAVRRHVEPERRALPLGAVYVLKWVERPAPLRIAPLGQVAAPVLLAATFNLVVRSPRRLERQLDLCAWIARNVPAYRIEIPPDVRAAPLAAAIKHHAETGWGMP